MTRVEIYILEGRIDAVHSDDDMLEYKIINMDTDKPHPSATRCYYPDSIELDESYWQGVEGLNDKNKAVKKWFT